MNLQYITDDTGKTTGVFIPISDWNELKSKYKDIDQEKMMNIPPSQMDEVRHRLEEYKNKPGQALDFDTAMDYWKRTLNVPSSYTAPCKTGL